DETLLPKNLQTKTRLRASRNHPPRGIPSQHRWNILRGIQPTRRHNRNMGQRETHRLLPQRPSPTRNHRPRERTEMITNRITGPAAIRAVNALLEDHYMITTSWGEEQCATCFENGGAIGAVEAQWPCDIYTTIQDAIGDQKHDRYDTCHPRRTRHPPHHLDLRFPVDVDRNHPDPDH